VRHSASAASRSHRQRRVPAPGPPGAAAGDPADDPAGDSVRGGPPGAGGPRRAAGRARWRQLPYAIVLGALVLALVWMRQSGQNVKGGTLAVAGILFAAALARLVLPERRAGMLVSRRRLADVAVLTALGIGLLVAGLMLPAQH
jgi:hypothetical protein